MGSDLIVYPIMYFGTDPGPSRALTLVYLIYDLGRFVPYFERPCLRSATPEQSSVPRTV